MEQQLDFQGYKLKIELLQNVELRAKLWSMQTPSTISATCGNYGATAVHPSLRTVDVKDQKAVTKVAQGYMNGHTKKIGAEWNVYTHQGDIVTAIGFDTTGSFPYPIMSHGSSKDFVGAVSEMLSNFDYELGLKSDVR